MVKDDIVCLGCGCLCDDIRIRDAAGASPQFERACELGQRWFSAIGPNLHPATLDGATADVDAALATAAVRLREARRPLLSGLEMLDLTTQRWAVKLADHLRGVVDAGGSTNPGPGSGRSTATFGEVAQRADVMIFWHCDPAATHPRHLQRISAEPRSVWLPTGRASRKLVLVHPGGATTTTLVDKVFASSSDQLAELQRLRLSLHKKQSSPLLAALLGGKYVAWFYDAGSTSGGALAELDALVIELQQQARSVVLPLGAGDNSPGAAAVLTWTTGFSGAVDFSLGYPRSFGDEFSATRLLSQGAVDLNLRFVTFDSPSLPRSAPQQIIIGPGAERFAGPEIITINTARLGVDAAGPVLRSDGVCVEAVAWRAAKLPSPLQFLQKVLEPLMNADKRR